ncbi:MAG TPA: hypothetical protein VMS71_05995, partial [Candidatus Acidoferrum sp.]|nr:hypothetical protein [Candidatus Acidoferrum sp.]
SSGLRISTRRAIPTNMGLEFIGRTLRTFGLVLLIFLPFGLYYMGTYPTLAILSGGVWGMINLIFLTELIRGVVRPEGVLVGAAIVIGVIKFPLLYLTVYALFKVPQFKPALLLIGFSGVLLVMVLKAAGRMLLGMDSPSHGTTARRA